METLHNNVTMYEICSQLTIKTPEQRLWRRSGELLLTLNKLNTFFWCFYHWLWISKCWLSNTPIKYLNLVYLMPCWVNFICCLSTYFNIFSWNTSTLSQVSNCDGVIIGIYLYHKFQWPQEGLNFESLAYEVAT